MDYASPISMNPEYRHNTIFFGRQRHQILKVNGRLYEAVKTVFVFMETEMTQEDILQTPLVQDFVLPGHGGIDWNELIAEVLFLVIVKDEVEL